MTLFLKDGILILYQIEQLSFNYILDNCFVDMYNFWFHFLSQHFFQIICRLFSYFLFFFLRLIIFFEYLPICNICFQQKLFSECICIKTKLRVVIELINLRKEILSFSRIIFTNYVEIVDSRNETVVKSILIKNKRKSLFFIVALKDVLNGRIIEKLFESM